MVYTRPAARFSCPPRRSDPVQFLIVYEHKHRLQMFDPRRRAGRCRLFDVPHLPHGLHHRRGTGSWHSGGAGRRAWSPGSAYTWARDRRDAELRSYAGPLPMSADTPSPPLTPTEAALELGVALT